jgi:hypothetical protein
VLDYLLAGDCGCASSRDFPAREVSESAAFVSDSAVGVAFLGSLRGVRLDPAANHQRDIYTTVDCGEALSCEVDFAKYRALAA